ncbi:MAG TPA: 3-deoxy-manno-octulosonate cytidylyltransferase [Nitrospira sp.]|nr:3-deoxy-manno-octulosonate cytidylyltransferase [Nitrospira sp.]
MGFEQADEKPRAEVTVVIPARYASSRFPGKPLALLDRKPIIQHVYEQAAVCRTVSDVVVATDDERIQRAVEAFGGRVVMTAGEFRNGTERVAAVARSRPGRFFLNLQGDEIPTDPELLTDLIEPFVPSGAEMGTLKRTLHTAEELQNPAVVKVVTDRQGRALYFSRAPIPLVRDDAERKPVKGLHYVHLGIYIYTRETLLRLASLAPGDLEEAEKLEQLRALDHGIGIRVWETQHASLRIDTPADALSAAETLRRLASNKPLETSTRL